MELSSHLRDFNESGAAEFSGSAPHIGAHDNERDWSPRVSYFRRPHLNAMGCMLYCSDLQPARDRMEESESLYCCSRLTHTSIPSLRRKRETFNVAALISLSTCESWALAARAFIKHEFFKFTCRCSLC